MDLSTANELNWWCALTTLTLKYGDTYNNNKIYEKKSGKKSDEFDF